MSKPYDFLPADFTKIKRFNAAVESSLTRPPEPVEFPPHTCRKSTCAFGGWWAWIEWADGTSTRKFFRTGHDRILAGYETPEHAEWRKQCGQRRDAAVLAHVTDAMRTDLAALAKNHITRNLHLTHRAERRFHERHGVSAHVVAQAMGFKNADEMFRS